VSAATPRVVAIFVIVGTLVSWLMVWMTERLFLFVHNGSYEHVLPPGLLGHFVLSLAWILPAQVLVAVLSGVFFSLFKRVPLWFVLSILIPVCGLTVTYRDVSDRPGAIQRSDYQKLLYWIFVITPGELLCARIVATKVQSPGDMTSALDDRS